jgi:exosortase A-associated hydrolase 2
LNTGRLQAQFIDGGHDRILVVSRVPAGQLRGAVLIAPPFAEEMNKTRKIFADLATALSRAGVVSVLPDLFGTGDSAGEFRDARWDLWKENLQRVVDWIASSGWQLAGVVGVRLGCALVAEMLRDGSHVAPRSVFWQPVLDGERYLTQFLRLRVAASMTDTAGKETVAILRGRLLAGESVEVAGYELAPALAAQIDRVRLADALGLQLGQLTWMELVRGDDGRLPGASQLAVDACVTAGLRVETAAIVGVPFWTSTEVVRNQELVARTIPALGYC